MAGLQEYKCPNCRGALVFDSTLQKMKCPFCDGVFGVEELEEPVTGDNTVPQEEEGLRIYVCDSCGGTVIGQETTAAMACPYCDNPVVMKGNVTGEFQPDLVIPFQLDKKAAQAAYRKHIQGKRLLPPVFGRENHIDEIKGLYVPFWLFDAEADGQFLYRAEKVRVWSDSRYHYTETEYYDAHRAGSLRFRDLPVDGAEKLPNDLTESVEPFDFSQAVPFRTAYLAGYLADKYDVEAEDCQERLRTRAARTTEDMFRNTVTGYDSVRTQDARVNVEPENVRYVLCPLWLLNTTWNGKKYTFAMNGQTGKMVGNLPLDKKRFFLWLAGLTAAGTALFTGISYLIWLLG